MNRHVAVFFLGVALVVTSMVSVDAAGPTPGKIGFVDLQVTLRKTPAGKRAKRKFDAYKKRKQTALDKAQSDFKKYAAALEKQRLVLKPAALRQRQRALEKKYVAVQQMYVKLERELASEQSKLIKSILAKAAPAIRAVAKKGGYSMVMDRSAILWADGAADITPAVNRRIK